MECPSIGPGTAAAIVAGIEVGRRAMVASLGDEPQITSPADAADLLPWMGHLPEEHRMVLILNTKHR